MDWQDVALAVVGGLLGYYFWTHFVKTRQVA